MEIGFIVLAIALIPGILFFLLPRHLRQRIQAQGHYFVSDLGDSCGRFSRRLQNMNENWQAQDLSKELLELVRDRQVAERLLESSRKSNPAKPKKWHLEKIIYDLKRGR
jgi:predicted TPR repeat methyltransferase